MRNFLLLLDLLFARPNKYAGTSTQNFHIDVHRCPPKLVCSSPKSLTQDETLHRFRTFGYSAWPPRVLHINTFHFWLVAVSPPVYLSALKKKTFTQLFPSCFFQKRIFLFTTRSQGVATIKLVNDGPPISAYFDRKLRDQQQQQDTDWRDVIYEAARTYIYIYILYINAEINRRFIRPIDCPLSRSRT